MHRCIQMWIVIREDWVSLSGDKSGRLICPVREWRVIGHIWPSVLWTVGTWAISTSGNWLMKHFRSSSTRLSSTDCDRVRHVCVSLWPEKVAKRCVCKCVCSLEKMAECGTPRGHLHNFISSIRLMMPAACWYVDSMHINSCVVAITISIWIWSRKG